MPTWTAIPGFPAYEADERGQVRKRDTGYRLSRVGKRFTLVLDGKCHRLTAADILERIARAGEAVDAVVLEDDEPETASGRSPRRGCRDCGKMLGRHDPPGRLCRQCAEAPPPPKRSVRRCVVCNAKLTAGYWRRCKGCLDGRDNGMAIFGVALL